MLIRHLEQLTQFASSFAYQLVHKEVMVSIKNNFNAIVIIELSFLLLFSFTLYSTEFWRHFVLSGGTQHRKISKRQTLCFFFYLNNL